MAMSTFDQSDGYGRALLVAVGLTVAGIIAQQLTVIPALALDPRVATDPQAVSRPVTAVFLMLSFVGFYLAGALYLWWSERGWGFIDIAMPTKRDLGIAVAAFLIAYAAVILVNLLTTPLEIDTPENQVMDFIGTDPTMVLIMIGIVFFFNAPAEEFLFRGVIQKRLYDAFSKRNAVVITTVIFTLVHVPVYFVAGATSIAGVSVVMAALFIGSIVFGYSYVMTDNLIVPTLAHAFFNAIQFMLLYLVLVYGSEEDIDAVTSAVLEVMPALGL